MPCVATDAIARILQWMELEPRRRQPDALPPSDEPLAIDRDEVRHAPTEPDMSMQPEAAAHRVDHAGATLPELLPFEEERSGVLRWRNRTRRCRVVHWQATTPSDVAGGGGAIVPEKSAQVSGYDCGCVAIADHPPLVAPVIVSTTPREP